MDDLTASGSFAVIDVDLTDIQSVDYEAQDTGYLGTYAASVTGNTTCVEAAAIGWTFTVNDNDVDYLAAGQTVTQKYDVTVSDGKGGTDTETVTITITGTNDIPIIGAGTFTGAVTEIADLASGANVDDLTATGSFAVTDVDLTDIQ